MERYRKYEKEMIEKAIIAALNAIAPDQISFDRGLDVFFVEIKDNGETEEESLLAALNSVTTDPQDLKEGYEDYYSSKEQSLKARRDKISHRLISGILFLIGAFLLVVIVVLAINLLPTRDRDPENAATTTPTSATSTPVATPEPTVAAASPTPTAQISTVAAIMAANGWDTAQYTTDTAVDTLKDRSTAGNGSFSKDGVSTIPEMIEYLQSDTKGAVALIGQIAKQTGANLSEMLDATNWVVIQSNVPFVYPGNTSLRDGVVVDAGSRKGKVGDIFLMFLSPSTGQYTFVRGACVNPQAVPPKVPENKPTPTPTSTPVVTPTPSPSPSPSPTPTASPTPTPPPTTPSPTPTPSPKFTSPDRVPGDGLERDSGTGVKPKVPVVTTPAESTPPTVNTMETITAPGAMPVVTPRIIPSPETVIPTTPAPTPVPTPTPRPVPTPEPGTGINAGDPGNPF